MGASARGPGHTAYLIINQGNAWCSELDRRNVGTLAHRCAAKERAGTSSIEPRDLEGRFLDFANNWGGRSFRL